jgi:hypothetical protein
LIEALNGGNGRTDSQKTVKEIVNLRTTTISPAPAAESVALLFIEARDSIYSI